MIKTTENVTAEAHFAKILKDFDNKTGVFDLNRVPKDDLHLMRFLVDKQRMLLEKYKDPENAFCGEQAKSQIDFVSEELTRLLDQYKHVK